jgi:hypothetical protein
MVILFLCSLSRILNCLNFWAPGTLLATLTSGNLASLEQSLTISSWIIDSMLFLPNPKSLRFFRRNRLCSCQYRPPVEMTPEGSL